MVYRGMNGRNFMKQPNYEIGEELDTHSYGKCKIEKIFKRIIETPFGDEYAYLILTETGCQVVEEWDIVY